VKVEILGSAGAVPTPRPGCDCRVCTAARELGAELGVELAYDGMQVEI
jgi:phosphoribosyl 1,2-cyclic phosphodiesterase